MTLDAPPQPQSTMRRDLITAYAASGMKVLSWAIAAGLIYRNDWLAFGVFALIRGTLSLLNYTTLGLAPAIIHRLAQATATPATPLPASPDGPALTSVLAYEPRDGGLTAQRVCYSALLLSVLIGLVGALISVVLAHSVDFGSSPGNYIAVPDFAVAKIVTALGIGLAVRLASDVCGAILQAYNRIAADNTALVFAELTWIAVMAIQFATASHYSAVYAAQAFLMSSVVLLAMRIGLMMYVVRLPRPRAEFLSFAVVGQLLGFGLLVSVAQLADFLYAPTDFWLIKQLLNLYALNAYAPAVQIDGALLMIVAGLASVLLPKSATAHARGNVDALRVYYVRGTLASLAMLAAAALIVWLASPWIFQLWLGDRTAVSRTILALVLIHTVVGGSSAVGRSILLGMGKVWPFTLAALIAGAANVLLSFTFVAGFGWGLKGIVLGTICAVVGRCAIWQPWYVWRCLKSPTP